MARLSMVTLGAFLDDTLVAESSELIFRGRMIAICALFRVPWIDQLGEQGG